MPRTHASPFARPPKWRVTAWNPLGDVCTLAHNTSRSDDLLQRLVATGVVVAEVLRTTPPDRSWIEDTIVFSGLDEAAVLAVAREFGQPAVTAWQDTFLTVVPTGLVDDIPLVTREVVVELQPRTCPMRIDDVEGSTCAMHGGPYGSRAIHASAVWKTHRDLLLPLLACDACEGGTQPTLGPLGKAGGPILLRDVGLASRYGGYVWS